MSVKAELILFTNRCVQSCHQKLTGGCVKSLSLRSWYVFFKYHRIRRLFLTLRLLSKGLRTHLKNMVSLYKTVFFKRNRRG